MTHLYLFIYRAPLWKQNFYQGKSCDKHIFNNSARSLFATFALGKITQVYFEICDLFVIMANLSDLTISWVFFFFLLLKCYAQDGGINLLGQLSKFCLLGRSGCWTRQYYRVVDKFSSEFYFSCLSNIQVLIFV